MSHGSPPYGNKNAEKCDTRFRRCRFERIKPIDPITTIRHVVYVSQNHSVLPSVCSLEPSIVMTLTNCNYANNVNVSCSLQQTHRTLRAPAAVIDQSLQHSAIQHRSGFHRICRLEYGEVSSQMHGQCDSRIIGIRIRIRIYG